MKRTNYYLLMMLELFSACQLEKIMPDSYEKIWHIIGSQLQVLVNSTESTRHLEGDDSAKISPRSLNADGTLKLVASSDWCIGFFPGCLWFEYEKTGYEHWEKQAENYTELLADQQFNGRTHDMGFKMYCSYGNGYRLPHDPEYRDILIQSAKTLATRFNEKVGCIRSWDHNQDKWKFPVIIDNMMNLELLFWATSETGDSAYYNIAVSHAERTMKNHFRPDNSCYHVVDYDPETGEVVHRQTHQGFADESAWARGQGWALYGFTMAYRETKKAEFLEQAEHVAHFILINKNMPDDLVPYWDFDAPNIQNEPRDASAAAVIASALLELSHYIPEQSATYKEKAEQILTSLTDSYRSATGTNQGFLLEHSTGSKPHDSEVNVPLIYADYYYIEATNRLTNYFD